VVVVVVVVVEVVRGGVIVGVADVGVGVEVVGPLVACHEEVVVVEEIVTIFLHAGLIKALVFRHIKALVFRFFKFVFFFTQHPLPPYRFINFQAENRLLSGPNKYLSRKG
jgi:hypothetical protein